jgi:hypothetical protein
MQRHGADVLGGRGQRGLVIADYRAGRCAGALRVDQAALGREQLDRLSRPRIGCTAVGQPGALPRQMGLTMRVELALSAVDRIDQRAQPVNRLSVALEVICSAA